MDDKDDKPQQTACLACGRPFGIEPLVWYRGLHGISKRMNWSVETVLRMNQLQGFWLFRLTNPTGKGWSYQTNDLAIHIWLAAQASKAYEHVAQTALGRRLRRTRSPAAPPSTPDASTTESAPSSVIPAVEGGAPPLDGARGGGVKPGPG